MKIYVPARSKEKAEYFKKSNPKLNNVEFVFEIDSLFDFINNIITSSDDDYAIIAHDDVFFSCNFNQLAKDLVTELNTEWPNWGICGNAGITPVGYNLGTPNIVRYLFDPHGGPNHQRDIFAAESIDGNTILLNCKALKEYNVKLPSLPGFQLYDISLSVETLGSGLAVLISPKLACFHNSGGNQKNFDEAKKNPTFQDYLSDRLSNRSIATLNGPIAFTYKRINTQRFDIEMRALENAAIGKRKHRVAIAIRTQFRSSAMLFRTVQSVLAFIATSGETTLFIPVIITDKSEHIPDNISQYAEVIAIDRYKNNNDTRFLLVQDALANVDADYFWFVDDDDWLFPNEAERVALSIACSPPGSIFFLGSQHFIERLPSKDKVFDPSYSISPGRYYFPQDWVKSLSGSNHIPFCGIIFCASTLRKLPDHIFKHITYYEDYTLQLFSLLNSETVPVIIDKLIAGISIRNNSFDESMENTVTQEDRTSWKRSCAELASVLCNVKYNPLLLNFPSLETPKIEVEKFGRIERKLINLYRLGRGIVWFSVCFSRWNEGFRSFSEGYEKGKIKGLLRSIRDFR